MPKTIQPPEPAGPNPPEENQERTQTQPVPPSSNQPLPNTAQQYNKPDGGSQTPDGMSANSLALKTNDRRWPGAIKKLLPVLVLIVVIGAGWLVYKNVFSGLDANTLNNGGYSYSVEFFKPSDQVRLNDGSEGLKHADSILVIKPSGGLDKLYSCSQIGSGWNEVFKVSIYDQSVPVCQPGSVGNFTSLFTALGQKHLFSITFKDAPSEEIYPELKTIFESVVVSEQ